MEFITTCAANEKFRNIVPLSERNIKRKEYEEISLRYFAYSNNYLNFQKSVEDFLTNYLKDENKKDSKENLDLLHSEFSRMLDFVEKYFPNGFKRKGYKTVARIRFEAISVGVTLALRENPELIPSDVTEWLESAEFIRHTRSDASNSRPKLINRIHFVRDNLLGRAVEIDPNTEIVEASANEDAPADNDDIEDNFQRGLFS